MVKTSILKRASYIGSALILGLATVPIVPSGSAWAEGESCDGPTTNAQLKVALNAGGEVTLCADIDGGVNVGHGVSGNVSAVLNLNGHNINAGNNGQALIVSNNASVVVNGSGILNRSNKSLITVNGSLVINGGTYNGLINAVGGSVTVNDGTFVADDSVFGLGHADGSGLTDTIVINDGVFSGKYIANKAYAGGGVNSALTINNGDFRGVTSGITKSNSLKEITTINGGVFGANPDGYEADGLDVYSYADTAVYWRVGPESELTAESTITAVLGEKVELFRAAPSEYVTAEYDVLNSSGADASSDVVIEEVEENGELVGYITATKQGRKEIDIRNNSNDAAHVRFLAYEIQGVTDQIMAAGDSKEITEIKSNKWNIGWSLTSSSNENVATVGGQTVRAVGSGKATITVQFADSANTTRTFDVYVYDFNEDEDTTPILIKKGDTATVRTDSNWNVSTDTTDRSVAELSSEGGIYTITGSNVGKTEITFSTNVDGRLETALTKTVNVYVYEVTDDEIYVDGNGQAVTFDGISLGSAADDLVVTAESVDASIADTDNSVYEIKGNNAGDTTLTYTLAVPQSNTTATVPVKVHVYTINAAESITLVEGATIGLNDARVAEIGNPAVVTARVVEGENYATIDNEATTDGKITASTKGTATVKYYVNGTEVASTKVKVYALQHPEDTIITANRMFLYPSNVNVGSNTAVNLNDENLPNYNLSTGSNLVRISGNVVSARFAAGEATVTVTYNDTLGGTTESFKVIISKYSEGLLDRDEYDLAQGGTTNRFRVSEEYDQSSVTLENDFGLEVANDNNGNWTVTAPEGFVGGEYTLKFIDEINGTEIATREVKIRVHEVVASDDTLYIKKDGDAATITVKEKNDYGTVRATVKNAAGRVSNGLTVTKNGDDFTIKVNTAGEYTVEFTDYAGLFGLQAYSTTTVKVYAIDFTVDKLEYHVVKGDTNVLDKMITALNRYWGETQADDTVTGFEILKSSNSKYYALWSGAEADKYEVEFYAYAGPDRYDLANREIRDTKTVTIYVYDMVVPSVAEYYDELGTNGASFDVIVGDKINDKIAGMAEISYELIEGDADGIEVDIENGKVNITKPGKYVVKYTDKMNRGAGDIVGDYTATFEVYNLDANAPKGRILDLTAGDTYTYTIDHANTYGEIETVITFTDPEGNVEEVSRTTTSYQNDSADAFEFTPEKEGKYTVRIENLSAKGHNIREVEKGVFYVLRRSYDFIMVELGETAEIESDSAWSVSSARDSQSRKSLTVEESKKVALDTTDMDLGARTVTLYHKFGKGQKEAIKTVMVVVYSVVADENTSELEPGEVTTSTLKNLFGKTAEATANLIREMLAGGVAESDVEAFVNKMFAGELTDEDIDNLGLTELFDNYKTVFGAEWKETIVGLNFVTGFGEEVTTDVKVTPITPTSEEEAEILKALDSYDVDHVDYYDVSVLMKSGDLEIGKIHQLDGKIVVALATVEDPAAGYARQYFVVRMHEGEEPVVLVEGEDFYIEDGVLYVISDKFSTYAVAYKDTLLPKAPNTGEEAMEESISGATQNTVALVAAAVLAAVTMAGMAVAVKRK